MEWFLWIIKLISTIFQVIWLKQEGYDNDSNILNDKDSSNEANDIFDLISQNSSNKANPPMKRGEMIKDDENKENKPPRTFKIDSLNLKENSSIHNSYGDIKIGSTNEIYINAKTSLGDTKINNNYQKSDVTLTIDNSCGDIRVNN